MKLQNIIYPSAENCTEEVLFFRREGDAKYFLADDSITLNEDALVSFDTYFNGFSVGKWMKYTKVNQVFLKIRIKGSFCITLVYLEKQMDRIYTKILKEQYYDTAGETKELQIPYECERNQGMYAFRLISRADGSKFYGGSYDTEVEEQEIESVKLAVVICTFKREKFIYKNMNMLKKIFLDAEHSDLKNRLYVYISDNAKTLDKKKIDSEHIFVFPNKNVGGSGGFTRGMLECMKDKAQKGITHVLLMDDDVILQPESIFRTYSLLSLMKPEFKNSYVGGAMLRMDMQWLQTEAGALWNAGMLLGRKAGLDLRDLDACLYNEVEEKYDYNAWWYCTIPMEYIRSDNLPLPIFIRGDDVEYGLRNMKNLILMNGICVWHEPFEFKYSSSMYYYIFRNRLIDNSIHDISYSRKQFLKDFKEWFIRELFTYRYKNAELLLRGANDFLKGVDWLKQKDGEELNQEIMQMGYQMKYVSELEVPFDFPEYDRTVHQFESRLHQLKRILLCNGMFLKTRGDAIVPTVDPHILYFYRKERVLHYDYASQKGFVTTRENHEFLRLYREYKKLKKNCAENYDKAVREFRTRGNELMSIGFWNTYLGLNMGGINE